ncbi:uncharacterized protein A4U43_C05F4650 [Asparagus officinalis]|uniref:Phosphatidylinositol N-acetylglucosaminyltransferase subunit H conserved domain-containing protein n=1 Tax=Asparagus officinalis TaxID=4686 RepID=A0A5P1ET22_ASPOF|nr:uncharacterized protein LOC109842740 [Asparagus officinalis]XP_020267201.1 uncharacterized protein LOC109842740 [Asparagus officinalis]XP_020267202.1 uncharacterized protein LOC109842740 [Asparagus officinalis]XP_020267203.1 uncharacterized protein LOC109842740 [Asparagus officinalis]XP_020267205.1 uncharacterized protein LOC109842740 [Asparagus officinalis]ONK67869.1 uncharacterized protein A4U43_C05F4650 [Asparagus officinalis]
MPHFLLSKCKYSYHHHDRSQKELSQAIDIHDISIAKNWMLVILSYFGTLLLIASTCYLLVMKEMLQVSSIWSIFVVIIFAKLLQYKPVKKESVVIMPEFGVQLETHYWSGRISRRFVPIGKILRPVINECVTPITCYWTLALIVREEEQLLLVFQELQPPLKMLVPVWKALCAATDCNESSSS